MIYYVPLVIFALMVASFIRMQLIVPGERRRRWKEVTLLISFLFIFSLACVNGMVKGGS